MCFKPSPQYQSVNSLSLTEYMRLQAIKNAHQADRAFLGYPEFLLKVDEGKVERTTDSLIELPTAVNMIDFATELVQSVFQNLNEQYDDVQWLTSRDILTPTNSHLQSTNNEVAEWLPETFSHYKSAESVVCDSLEAQNAAELRCPQEILNSVEFGSSLPDHTIS